MIPCVCPTGQTGVVWENVHVRYTEPLVGGAPEPYRDPVTALPGEFVRVRKRNKMDGGGLTVSTPRGAVSSGHSVIEIEGPFIGNVVRRSESTSGGRTTLIVRLSAQAHTSAEVVVDIVDDEDDNVVGDDDAEYFCLKDDGLMDVSEFAGYWGYPTQPGSSAVEISGAAERIRRSKAACVLATVLAKTEMLCCEDDNLIGGAETHTACNMVVVRELYAAPVESVVRGRNSAVPVRDPLELKPSLGLIMYDKDLDERECSDEKYETNCASLMGAEVFGYQAHDSWAASSKRASGGSPVASVSKRTPGKNRRESHFGERVDDSTMPIASMMTVDTWTPAPDLAEAQMANITEDGESDTQPCCFPRMRITITRGKSTQRFWQRDPSVRAWAAVLLKAGCNLVLAPGIPASCGATPAELLATLKSFDYGGRLSGHVRFAGSFFEEDDISAGELQYDMLSFEPETHTLQCFVDDDDSDDAVSWIVGAQCPTVRVTLRRARSDDGPGVTPGSLCLAFAGVVIVGSDGAPDPRDEFVIAEEGISVRALATLFSRDGIAVHEDHGTSAFDRLPIYHTPLQKARIETRKQRDALTEAQREIARLSELVKQHEIARQAKDLRMAELELLLKTTPQMHTPATSHSNDAGSPAVMRVGSGSTALDKSAPSSAAGAEALSSVISRLNGMQARLSAETLTIGNLMAKYSFESSKGGGTSGVATASRTMASATLSDFF